MLTDTCSKSFVLDALKTGSLSPLWRSLCEAIPRPTLYELLQELNHYYYFCKWPDDISLDGVENVSFMGVAFRRDHRGYWSGDKMINGTRYWVYVGKTLNVETASQAYYTILERAGGLNV